MQKLRRYVTFRFYNIFTAFARRSQPDFQGRLRTIRQQATRQSKVAKPARVNHLCYGFLYYDYTKTFATGRLWRLNAFAVSTS